MFSVIVPIYNAEKYLRRCVDSILAQTYTDYELLLIDDGSPDKCPHICDEYAQLDPRIRVIHKSNGGLISARNVGIREARGEYIFYVDADDWAKPNMLQFVYNKLVESPVPLDMVLFAADNFHEDYIGATTNNVPEGYYDRKRLETELFPYMIVDTRHGFQAGCIQAHTWDKACRRELQAEHYTRDERIHAFTDVPMTFGCLLHCQNVYICNEHLYNYNRTNEHSIRAKSKENLLTKSFYYLTVYIQEHLSGYTTSVDRQLNIFPATLITRTIKYRLATDGSVSEAAQHVKERLDESDILSRVSPRGLPPGPQLLITLLKLHLYKTPVMISAAILKVKELRRR